MVKRYGIVCHLYRKLTFLWIVNGALAFQLDHVHFLIKVPHFINKTFRRQAPFLSSSIQQERNMFIWPL
jgi:hypothetical protein